MIIDRKAVKVYLNRELDSYLWMKKLRRESLERHLAAMRVPPRFKTEPWLHQLVCAYIGFHNPRFLFLLDMGLGKSKIFLDLITQVQRERGLDRACIVVPRLINVDSWVEDVPRHSDLEPQRIDCNEIEEKRERLLNPKGDISIIDIGGLMWALCKKEKGEKGKTSMVRDDKVMRKFLQTYNWLGVDEIHKLGGNHNSLWWNILNYASARMDYSYGASGTIIGKDAEQYWPPFYLIDQGAALGETLGIFRAAFFIQKTMPFKGVKYVFDDRLDDRLHEMAQHSSIRYDENEVPDVDLPALVRRKRVLVMGDEQREHYLRAVEGIIDAGGGRQDLEASWFRMRQITSGYLGWRDDLGDHVMPFADNPKLQDLEDTIERLNGKKIVISCEYTETGRLITNRLKELGISFVWLYGGSKEKPGVLRQRFMDDPKCQAFVMNSEAGGTGNDGLQKVAQWLYLYETPSDPRSRAQVIKRVHRPGQPHRTFVIDAVIKGSVDTGILESIEEGEDLFRRVVNGQTRGRRNLFLA